MKLFQISVLVILFYSGTAFGQELSNFKIRCEKIKIIDSLEFEQNKMPSIKISKSKGISKDEETLTIKTIDSSLVFKDNLSNEAFFMYSYLGEFQEYNWTLILGQDYNQNYYYLINKNTSRIDSIVGFTQIFKNEVLAIESSYTDGSALIEIWDIEKNQIKKVKSFSIKKCMIYNIQEAFLNEDYLYIRDLYTSNKDDYYKVKIK